MGYKIKAIIKNEIMYMSFAQKPVNIGYEWKNRKSAENIMRSIKNSKQYKRHPYYLEVVESKPVRQNNTGISDDDSFAGVENLFGDDENDGAPDERYVATPKPVNRRQNSLAFGKSRRQVIDDAIGVFLSLSENDVNDLKSYISHCDGAITDIEHHIELTEDVTEEEKCDCFDFIRNIKRRRRKAKDTLAILGAIQTLKLNDRHYNVREIPELFKNGEAVNGNPYADIKDKEI